MGLESEHTALDDQDWSNRRPQIFKAEIRKFYGAYIGVAVLSFIFVASSWIGSSHHRIPAPRWLDAMFVCIVLAQLLNAIYLQTVFVKVDGENLLKQSIFGSKNVLLSDTFSRLVLQPRIGESVEIKCGSSLMLMTPMVFSGKDIYRVNQLLSHGRASQQASR